MIEMETRNQPAAGAVETWRIPALNPRAVHAYAEINTLWGFDQRLYVMVDGLRGTRTGREQLAVMEAELADRAEHLASKVRNSATHRFFVGVAADLDVTRSATEMGASCVRKAHDLGELAAIATFRVAASLARVLNEQPEAQDVRQAIAPAIAQASLRWRAVFGEMMKGHPWIPHTEAGDQGTVQLDGQGTQLPVFRIKTFGR